MTFTIGVSKTAIAPGTYPAMLEAVNLKNIVSRFSPDGEDMREWLFQVNVNGELKPCEGLTSQATGPASTAYRWLTALLRRELRAGETIESPVGQNCLVVITQNGNFSKVRDVLPAPTVEQTTLPDGSSVPR